MKKKMTRKKALKLLDERFGNADYYIYPLCHSMPEELQADFMKYWRKINTSEHLAMSGYFRSFLIEGVWSCTIWDYEVSTLRLLTAFFFIEDTYK